MHIINIPDKCPICGGPTEIVKSESGVETLICTNPQCNGKIINILDHYCGKTGMDIKGLSKATLEKLIDWGWLNSIEDIYTLKNYRSQWIKKAGFGVKSVDNILNAIEESRNCAAAAFVTALGIPLVGGSTAKILMNKLSTWKNFRQVLEGSGSSSIMHIDGIGVTIYEELLHFNYGEADRIANKYLNFITENNTTTVNNSLKNLIFVITGKVNHFKNREALKSFIESYGGRVASSVSSKTTALIANEKENTSKYNRAEELNIPILTEENFLKKYNLS